ncbi:hypothetical protein AAEO57_19040 [Flavobacterium sp. DGU38]|uniref:DUF3592 domain-containing protein n=1 Tax=Flavobacterium calami TaxID=3139144 RepID=A0ABU9ITZ5_9FLAO
MKKFIIYLIIIYSSFYLIIELTYNFPKFKTSYSFLCVKGGIVRDTLLVSSNDPASHSGTTSTSIVYKGILSSNNETAQITLSNSVYPYLNERKDYAKIKPNKIIVYHSNLSSHFLFIEKPDSALTLGLTYFIDPVLFFISIFLILYLLILKMKNKK